MVNSMIRHLADEVVSTVIKRGEAYGPEMFEIMGLDYTVPLTVAKALRAWWGWMHGRRVRKDDFLDLAAYALLTLMVMVHAAGPGPVETPPS
jgi:hypothetical protein